MADIEDTLNQIISTYKVGMTLGCCYLLSTECDVEWVCQSFYGFAGSIDRMVKNKASSDQRPTRAFMRL